MPNGEHYVKYAITKAAISMNTLVSISVMPACPASFFEERFPTSGNDKLCRFTYVRLSKSKIIIHTCLTLINNTYNIRIKGGDMPKTALRKEKWTLSFDQKLKKAVIREAEARGMYPGNFLEELVREKINPYGHTDIKDSVNYVKTLRKKSGDKTDREFLEEILQWRK
jgi:hypothetical protein